MKKDTTKTMNLGHIGKANRNGGDPLGVNTEIGRKLRQFYDGILSDAVPERFTQLLSQLEQAESAQKKD